MNLGLAGKVALVTGGARDVGREISLALAREGAAVAVNYMHSKAEADAVVAEIARLGGRAAAHQADVADYAAVSAMIDKIVADVFGSLTRQELIQRLEDADIAFGEVNTMADLTVHPHLRRIEVDTPKGVVTYSAPAVIFVGQPRHYGRVPAIGEHDAMPKAKVRKSS